MRLDIRMLGDGNYGVRADTAPERELRAFRDGIPAYITVQPGPTTVVVRSIRVTSGSDYPDASFTPGVEHAGWRTDETIPGTYVRPRDDIGYITPGALEVGTLASTGVGVGTVGFERDALGARYLLHTGFRPSGLVCPPQGSAIFAGIGGGSVAWAIEAESIVNTQEICSWRPIYRDANGIRRVLADPRTFTFSPWHEVEVEVDEGQAMLTVLVDKKVLGSVEGAHVEGVERIVMGKVDLVDTYERGGHWDDTFAITT